MVRLRAFGAYAMRVADPAKLLRELVGTDPQFRTEEVQEFLRQLIVGHLGSALATAQVPVLDLAAQQLRDRAAARRGRSPRSSPATASQIPKFVIENISLPPEVEEALDKRTSMGVVGNLDHYTKFQAANAIEDAANNPRRRRRGLRARPRHGRRAADGERAQPAGQPRSRPARRRPGRRRCRSRTSGSPASAAQQQGPYDVAGARRAGPRAAPSPATTLVWKNGMAQWTPAGQVPELGALFAAVPPPLPPQGCSR